jgi:group I intron endonuclease
MGYIYMLKSPSGRIYIGQTIRPIQERLEEHRTGKSSRCRGIYNAIKKHGWENFVIDWYECSDEDLNFDEELLVREMGTLSPGGYNLREGGGNCGKMSEETKQKLSEATCGKKHHMYGKKLSDDHKQKIGEAQRGEKHPMYGKTGEKHHMFGKTHSEETKQKIGDGNRGKQLSVETKQKISESKKGEKHPMYGKTGERHPNSKRVYQYDLDGNFVQSFGSGREAGRHLGKHGIKINECARSQDKNKTAYGFKWSHSQLI